MLRLFNNLNIQNKIFFTFAPILFLVILSTSYFFYTYAEQNIMKKAGDANLNVLYQISGKMELINSNINSVATMYFLDPSIKQLLNNDWTGRPYEELVSRYQVNALINTVNNNFQYLKHRMTLIGINGNYYNSEDTDRRDEDKRRSASSLQQLEADKSRMVWTDTYRLNDNYIFSVVSYMRNVYNGKDLGLLILDFDENILFDTYKSMENNHIRIYNSQGILISGPDKSRLTMSEADADFFKKLNGNRSGYFLSDYEGTETLVSFYQMQPLGWYIVDMTPLSSLLEGMRGIKAYVLFIALAELVILFVLSYMIAYAISSPIKKLVHSIHLAGIGNLKQIIDLRRKDEIGVLVSKYNMMLERIDRLMKEAVVQHEKKRQAEMQGLQAQMNPHFLYNTLNSIRWMVRTNQPEVTDHMIISLVRLLRQNFNNGSELITFADELKFLSDYILIQKVRYGDKFDVSCEFDKSMLACYTLRLLIQPILENAIFHGIEPKEGVGMISIKGRVEEEKVVIDIFDDGVGMDWGAQPSPLSGGPPPEREFSNGIGLRNIEHRIKLHFGEGFGITLKSAKDWGTHVTIVLPVIREREAIR